MIFSKLVGQEPATTITKLECLKYKKSQLEVSSCIFTANDDQILRLPLTYFVHMFLIILCFPVFWSDCLIRRSIGTKWFNVLIVDINLLSANPTKLSNTLKRVKRFNLFVPFYRWLSNERSSYFCLFTIDWKRVINFVSFREVLCSPSILNLQDRIDWKQCKVDKEHEIRQTKKFRERFKLFDFNFQWGLMLFNILEIKLS